MFEIGDRVKHRDLMPPDTDRELPGLEGHIVGVYKFVVEWDSVIREGMFEGKQTHGFYPPEHLLSATGAKR
jgi:hypothetical protein